MFRVLSSSLSVSALVGAMVGVASTASAQSLGTFSWQMQPYCNVVTLSVTQQGSVYTLDGFDDQCGAATKAPVTGSAVPNADGTIQFGLNIVSSPGGVASHVAVPLSIPSLGGSWKDSDGNSGTFAFGASTGGSARPLRPVVPIAIALKQDGGILSRGQEVSNGTPNSKGTGMLWDPGKGAFRAGGLFTTDDDDTIGYFSVGVGWGVKAQGFASVAFGTSQATGDRSVAIGGAVATGARATAIGSLASAFAPESLALGSGATTDAVNAVAIGARSRALHSGAIVMGDGGSDVSSSAAQQFTARARGGVRFFSNVNMTTGVQLAANASAWSSLSDVNSKENFRDLDGADLLGKLARMSIREWNYKAQDAAIRHVGPTAQDFHVAFGLGEDPLRISTIDADGIALAGVSALARENARAKENQELRDALATMSADLAALRAELAALRESAFAVSPTR